MALSTKIYSKTGKGVRALSSKSRQLPANALKILAHIDSKTDAATIMAQFEKLSEDAFNILLSQLENDGYIRSLNTPEWDLEDNKLDSQTGMVVDEISAEDFYAIVSEPEPDAGNKSAEEKAQEAAAEKAKKEAIALEIAEMEVRLKAARKARENGYRKAREEAERKAREEEDARRKDEANAHARIEEATMLAAEYLAREEAERLAREEVEREEVEVRRKAEAEARAKAEQEARLEVERIAREEAERLAREETERRAREEEEARRKAEAEARAKAEQEARLEAERLTREEAERKAREEEEARRKDEAEARARAEEAARLEVERIAREEAERLAREETERKAREEEEARRKAEAEARAKAEQEARLEAERLAREEAERKAREEEEARRKAEAEARAKAEQEARLEAERIAREETERKAREEKDIRLNAAAEARARAKEEARQKAEQKAREKAESRIAKRVRAKALRGSAKPGKWAAMATRTVFIYMPLALVALVGLLHFVNLGLLAAPIEKFASATIGEPVAVRDVRASLFPKPRLKLSGIRVGADAEMEVGSLQLSPAALTLFDEVKTLKSLEIEQLVVDAASLDRQMQWIRRSTESGKLRIKQISLKKIAFKIPSLDLAPLDGRIEFLPSGDFSMIELGSADQNLTLRLTPQNGNYQVALSAFNWQPPLGTPLQFTRLSAEGIASRSQVRFSRIEGSIYGGTFTANGIVEWATQPSASGNFELENVSLPLALSSMESSAAVDGTLDASASFSSKASEVGKLAEAPTISATFRVMDGKIHGIDLTSAMLPGGGRDNSTRFDKLTGKLQLRNGLYQYRQLALDAAQFHARGNLDIQSNQDISGRVSAELAVSSRQIRSNLSLAGKVGDVRLK